MYLRKPKLIRKSDIVMNVYLDAAKHFTELASVSTITVEEKYEVLKEAASCMKKASKTGGFFSIKGLQEYLESPKN